MELKSLKIKKPEGLNIILGQAHFIKTIEDLYESIIGSAVGIKFAIAFCEASGPCLVRVEGNNDKLKKIVSENNKVSGPMEFVTDISKLTKITGWKPKYDITAGLKKTYEIMKSYYKD